MERGSDKILQAWRTRLDDAAVEGIAKHYDDSAGEVVSASASDGALNVVSRYGADDFEQCGNDLAFWLRLHLNAGGTFRPPRIFPNGRPSFDSVTMSADYFKPVQVVLGEIDQVGQP